MTTERPRVVASIEARMGSSRLPGKMLMDVNGKAALARVVDRLRHATAIDDIVLATTVNTADDVLATWANAYGIAVHRGSEGDVLQRVVESHRLMESEIVVEVTGDCTLLDPEIIDLGVATFRANACDVVANVVKPSFPQGVDVQVFPLALLEAVECTVHDPAVREHVSLHFYENAELYRVLHLMAPPRYRAPEHRFQLDYPEDLAFIREVYRRLEPLHGDRFGTPEVLELLSARPELAAINAHCQEKPVR
jgi:spore coat polysaccharide biosynthesis protein SpsF